MELILDLRLSKQLSNYRYFVSFFQKALKNICFYLAGNTTALKARPKMNGFDWLIMVIFRVIW